MEKLSPTAVLDFALRTSKSYARQGMGITLRQLYYRGVAGGLWPSGDAEYKRLGDILARARLNGTFPLDGLEDRGRRIAGDNVRCQFDRSAAIAEGIDLISNMEYHINADRWYRQPIYPLVLIEKEALAGFVGDVCEKRGVPFMACKGYPSHSVLYDLLKQIIPALNWRYILLKKLRPGKTALLENLASEGTRTTFEDSDDDLGIRIGFATTAKILYCGDMDPDGMEIPQSIEKTLNTLTAMNPSVHELLDPILQTVIDEAVDKRWYDWGDIEDEWPRQTLEDDHVGSFFRFPITIDFQVERLALTPQQVEEYRPIPFVAKRSSARFAAYERWIEDFIDNGTLDMMPGGEYPAYELDALEPAELIRLIETAIDANYDDGIASENDRRVKTLRSEFKAEFRQEIAGWIQKD